MNNKKRTMRRVKDIITYTLFLMAFFFVGSGLLECCILKLLSLVGW